MSSSTQDPDEAVQAVWAARKATSTESTGRSSTPEPEGASSSGRAAAHRSAGLIGDGFAQTCTHTPDYGGLDSSHWRSVEFQPPSLAAAKDAAESSMLLGGQGRPWRLRMEDFAAFGIGAALHFRFLRLLTIYFCVSTCLSAPVIALFSAGSRFTSDEVDSLQLVTTMLGNLGPDPRSQVNASATQAAQESYSVSPAGLGGAWTWSQALQGAAYLDFMYSALLLLCIGLWWHSVSTAEARQAASQRLPRSSDYAVWVHGLPEDATEEQVRAHFDRLYNLRKPDWTHHSSCSRCWCYHKPTRRRQFLEEGEAGAELARWQSFFPEGPPSIPRWAMCEPCAGSCAACRRDAVVGDPEGPPADWKDWYTHPVRNASNTSDDGYLQSWVAEVAMATANADRIAAFRRVEQCRQQLLRCRAAIRAYERPSWLQSTQSTCACTDGGVDASCAAGTGRCCFVFVGPQTNRLRQAEQRLQAIQRTLQRLDVTGGAALSMRVAGAFVTFNNEESWRRCVADYRSTHRWHATLPLCGMNSACQPAPLRFKGIHPLSVEPAPEPSDVIWENLQVPAWQRSLRVLATSLCMLLFLAASLAAIVAAQRQQEEFNTVLPLPSVCSVQAPSIVYGANSVPAATSLQRQRALDAQCRIASGRDDVLFLWWGGANALPVPADLTAPLANVTDVAGRVVRQVPNACATPCIPSSVQASEPCVVPAGAVDDTLATPTFPVHSLLGCFCLQVLQDKTQERGAFTGAYEVLDEFPSCAELATAFAASQGLVVFAALGVTLTNALLHTVLSGVTRFERHNTHSATQHAVARKLFLALFLNTGLIVLLVNAKVPGLASAGLGLFSGRLTSFSPGWFPTAGLAVALTMLINILAPHVGPLARIAARPCWRRCCIASRRLQQHLNELYQPPAFQVESRVAHVLNTVVVTLLYSSGIPILLPFAAIALTLHCAMDVAHVLWVVGKPAPMDTTMARFALRVLPVALVLHCAFGVWFYSDPDTAPTMTLVGQGDSPSDPVPGWVQPLVDADVSVAGVALAERLLLKSTFPLVALLLVTLLGTLLASTCGPVLSTASAAACSVLTGGRCCKPDAHVAERMLPPFTGTYAEKLPPGVPTTLPAAETAAGWRVILDNRRGTGAEQKVKQATSSDAPALRGSRYKLTWQVIAEQAVPSYVPAAAPAYAAVVAAAAHGVRLDPLAAAPLPQPASWSPRKPSHSAVAPEPPSSDGNPKRVPSSPRMSPRPYKRPPVKDYTGGVVARAKRSRAKPPPREAWTMVAPSAAGQSASLISHRLGTALPEADQ